MKHFKKNKNDLLKKRKAKKKRIQEQSNYFYDAELVNKKKYLDEKPQLEYNIIVLFGLFSCFFFELLRGLIYPYFPIIYDVIDGIVINIMTFIINLIGIKEPGEAGGCGCISFTLLYFLREFVLIPLRIGVYIALVYILCYIYNNVIYRKAP